MLEWLTEAPPPAEFEASLAFLAGRLAISFALGSSVAGVYVVTQWKHRTELASLATTLVLLTILITMVTLVIGNSVARAFSLVGALAIVRFRTVVEDTRDTAFVIFAVIVGMGVGAGHVLVPLVGIPVVAAAALLANLWSRPAPAVTEHSLAIRLSIGRDPKLLLTPVFDKHLTQVHLRAATSARQGAALDLTYLVRLRNSADPVALVTELNQIEGVQNVEWRGPSS